MKKYYTALGLCIATIVSCLIGLSVQAFAAPNDLPAAPVLSQKAIDQNLAIVDAVADPSGYDCDPKYDIGSVKFTKKSDVLVTIYVFYRYCSSENPQDAKKSFVEPTHTRGAYNVEGDHHTCNKFNGDFTGVRVNMYFWRPATGANWNPKEFHIPCDESTMNAVTQYYDLDDVPRLYFGPDAQRPKWKANVEKERFGLNEHKSFSQAFTPEA